MFFNEDEDFGKPEMFDVGDYGYRIRKLYKRDEYYVSKIRCTEINYYYDHNSYTFDDGYHANDKDVNKNIFYTEEDAKEELRRRLLTKTKKQKLKEYEEQLNKEFNITTTIIK